MIQPLNKNQKIPTKNIENIYFVKSTQKVSCYILNV